MTKRETLKMLNDEIDKLIIKGKTKTLRFKLLCRLHQNIVSEMKPITK